MKKIWIFSKSNKVANYLWSACQMTLVVKNIFSTLFVSFFVKKNQKNRKNFENNAFILEKASSTKLEGGKHSSGSQLSC